MCFSSLRKNLLGNIHKVKMLKYLLPGIRIQWGKPWHLLFLMSSPGDSSAPLQSENHGLKWLWQGISLPKFSLPQGLREEWFFFSKPCLLVAQQPQMSCYTRPSVVSEKDEAAYRRLNYYEGFAVQRHCTMCRDSTCPCFSRICSFSRDSRQKLKQTNATKCYKCFETWGPCGLSHWVELPKSV